MLSWTVYGEVFGDTWIGVFSYMKCVYRDIEISSKGDFVLEI